MKMHIVSLACMLLAVAGCTSDNDSTQSPAPEELASATDANAPDKGQLWKTFTKKAEDALGTFDDIHVWPDAMPDGGWEPNIGTFIPVTVDGQTPTTYRHNMRSDRPMVLPTQIEATTGGDGQSNPYTVVGRQPGSNPEVQWMFLVRQYSMKEITDPNLDMSPDMAVIGHHPRTGASAYWQYFNDGKEKSSKVVVSPFSENGEEFWADIETLKNDLRCERCHSADAFIHTPWVDQARVDTVSWEGYAQPMVPSNPLGPFFFVDSGPGEYFEDWNLNLQYLDDPQNACTECHRVSPFSMLGLNSYATLYAGISLGEELSTAIASDGWQTDHYHERPWMPPLVLQDFYAGQQIQDSTWFQDYGASSQKINELERQYSEWMIDGKPPSLPVHPDVKRVPRPPAEYQSIMVDRPEQDSVESGQSLVILDSRMRANSDGDLYKWRFIGKGAVDSQQTVTPVVLRRHPGDGSAIELEVIFVGSPRGQGSAGSWVTVNSDEIIEPVRLGDYFGVVITNSGNETAPGLIPYSTDDWAKITGPDGTTRFPYGYVTYSVTLDNTPAVGETVNFNGSTEYRTYSFEFQNRL